MLRWLFDSFQPHFFYVFYRNPEEPPSITQSLGLFFGGSDFYLAKSKIEHSIKNASGAHEISFNFSCPALDWEYNAFLSCPKPMNLYENFISFTFKFP